jgi:hypothetical protein
MADPITSRVNQYLGVNAHFQSLALSAGNHGLWREFHRSHITDLTRALNDQLEPKGYIAHQEDSLQIGFFDRERNPESDILIRDVSSHRDNAEASVVATPVLAIPAEKLIDSDESRIKDPSAVKIYRLEDDEAGLPITWIELLSPSNKTGQGYDTYKAKRDTMLQLGIVFVELDYLHGVSTSLETILDYRPPGRKSQPSPDAHPYHIWMINPRLPRDDEQSAALASFTIDDPLPHFHIPLRGQDILVFNFNTVYHETFRLQPGFGRRIDYTRPPVNARDDYNARDLRAIAARMLTVQALAARGVDLAEGPFPLDAEVVTRLEADPAQVSALFG